MPTRYATILQIICRSLAVQPLRSTLNPFGVFTLSHFEVVQCDLAHRMFRQHLRILFGAFGDISEARPTRKLTNSRTTFEPMVPFPRRFRFYRSSLFYYLTDLDRRT